ncbi:MAG: GGDEF domain-containing protein [Pseudomonadota bacterium]
MSLAAQFRRGLAWVEQQLKLRHATVGIIFISTVALAFVLVLFIKDVAALFLPAAGRFYQPGMLAYTVLQEGVSLLFYLAVLAWCLPRYRSAEPQPWLASLVITYMLVAAANLSVLYGHKDTPLPLVFLASVVLARAWFPLRLLLPGLVLSVLLVTGAEVAMARGLLRYAPLLAEPVVTGKPLGWWWDIWVRVIYDMVVVFFAIALFFIFGLMERRHRELEELSRYDTLTGLLNRGSFMRLLEEEFGKQLRSRRPACVMMCDVDLFKRINDVHGHPAGDVVLARLGQVLGAAVRQPIDVPARFGGEEFVVLLPETTLPAAEVVAERIRSLLAAETFHGEGGKFGVSLSIGIAESSDGDGERALRVADANLYHAKRGGRDAVVASRTSPAD